MGHVDVVTVSLAALVAVRFARVPVVSQTIERQGNKNKGLKSFNPLNINLFLCLLCAITFKKTGIK